LAADIILDTDVAVHFEPLGVVIPASSSADAIARSEAFGMPWAMVRASA
jgi:hypothetical protein